MPIYFAGDTCVFGDMQLIRHLYEPRLAVLPIGDHFTMGPQEAAVALDMLGSPRCVPCHWGTFPLLTRHAGGARRARRRARSSSSSQPGDTIELDDAARRDVLDRRLRPRRRSVGRRDAVEVPRRRLGRAVGGAARRRDRDAGLREPALRPRGAAAARGGPRRARGRRAASTAADDGRDHRQLGVVDGRRGRDLHRRGVHGLGGRVAGPCFAAQGNILVSDETVDALAAPFMASAGGRSPSGCSTALAAAQAAGGDRRGQQSAALLVVERDGGYAGLSDPSSTCASTTTRRRSTSWRGSTRMHQLLFGKTPPASGRGRRRPRRRARASASRASATRASSTRRFEPGPARRTSRSASTASTRIDPVVLEELRQR